MSVDLRPPRRLAKLTAPSSPAGLEDFHFMRPSPIAALALALIAASPAAAADAAFPHRDSDLPADPAVIYGQLENGLRYAILENDTPSDTAALRLRIDMGSLMEADDQRGLAHFLEHMAFNGSENVPEGEMVRILERAGLAFGPDTNAYTSFDETVYMLDLPETDAETLNTAFFLMSEIDDLLLEEEAIENERGVVLSEMRVRNTPGFRAAKTRYEFLYPEALISERFAIGVEDVLASAARERFDDIYRKYYRPERAFFVAVGDFEASDVEARIAEAFGDWTVAGDAGPDPDLGEIGPRGLEAAYFREPSLPTSVSLNFVRPYEAIPDTSETRLDETLRGLGNAILSRRFATISRREDAPFLSAGASHGNVYETAAMASVSAVTEPARWREALATLEQELRRAREHGFTQAELDEQVANLRTAYRDAAEGADTRQSASLAGAITGAFADDSVFVHPRNAHALFAEQADELTLEAVEAAFREEWRDSEPLIFLSTSADIADAEAAILAAYRDSAAEPVKPPPDAAAAEFAYQDFGAPGAVVSRETVEDLGIVRIRFDNNVMLNFKQTDFDQDAVVAQIRFGGGALETPEGGGGLRYLFSNTFAEGGVGAHSLDEIQRLMAGKSVGLNFSAGSDAFSASAATTPGDLQAQLRLWTAYMTDPAYRPESLAQFKQLYRVFYRTLDATPSGILQRDLAPLIHSGDSRFSLPGEAEVEAWSLDDARAYIEPARAGAALEIGVVGDITEAEAVSAVARTLGAIAERAPSRRGFEEARGVDFPLGGDAVTLRHDGEADQAMALVYWPAPDGRDAALARRLTLLSEIFQLKLTDRVREQEAAAYSPNAAYAGYREFPGYGYFRALLELDPADVEPFFDIVDELARDMREGRFDADELERARRPLLEDVEESEERNGYWLGVVGEAQTDPEALDRHRSRRADYESATLDELKALAAGQFDPGAAYRIRILPPETG